MNNIKIKSIFIFFCMLISQQTILTNISVGSVQTPDGFCLIKKLPIGMNLDDHNYYTPSLPFNDAMKTASEMFSYPSVGGGWNSGLISQVPRDNNGWPLQIPYSVNGIFQNVRFLISDFYTGEYAVVFDGEGEITFGGVTPTTVNGIKHIKLTGTGKNVWINIVSSTKGNHIRNMRIIPNGYLGNESAMPTFRADYIDGLKAFHALRFMKIGGTKNSTQREWADRTTKTYFTQGTENGIAWEYMVEMANQLNEDAWICIPHQASDDYIYKLAILFKDKLNPGLKIYLEYSNELWNWALTQSHYILNNAPNHPNSYVSKELAALSDKYTVRVSTNTFSGAAIGTGKSIMFSSSGSLPAPLVAYKQYFVINTNGSTFQVAESPGGSAVTITDIGTGTHSVYIPGKHPEKDAYMMARTFRIFSEVFGSQMGTRVIRLATSQTAWPDNSRRILDYLFNTDGIGADALSVAGYFSYKESDHATWNAMAPSAVTPEMILQSTADNFSRELEPWSRSSGKYAVQYGVDYIVYEGGQSITPYNQKIWNYNQAIYDAQIHPMIYDLYMKNFKLHNEDIVNCKLFMAFSYIGLRQNNYGSWGHFESLSQTSPQVSKKTAPKARALFDINSTKNHQ